MRQVGRHTRNQSDGVRNIDAITQLKGPATLFTDEVVKLPQGDASAFAPRVLSGVPGEKPFDNGTSNYKTFATAHDGANGLRAYFTDNDDLSGFTNGAPITGFTGGALALIPTPVADMAGHKNWLTATKKLLYINGSHAGNSYNRLRILDLSNDNNATGSNDRALGTGYFGSDVNDWNYELDNIFWAQYNSNGKGVSGPLSHEICALCLMSNDVGSSISIAWIYGSIGGTLKSTRISVIYPDPKPSSLYGYAAVTPLLNRMGMSKWEKIFGGLPCVITAQAPLPTSDTSFYLGVLVNETKLVFLDQNPFLADSDTGATPDFYASSLQYRDDQTVDKFQIVTNAVETGAGKVRTFLFSGFGNDSDVRGSGTVLT